MKDQRNKVKEEKFDALIIDPDPASRMRLKHATASCSEFGHVKLSYSLIHALQSLKDGLSCNIVFISQALDSEQASAFVREARETSRGRSCAYIMIVNGRRQTRTGIAHEISNGMDGFLFQPFSVDALRETTRLAATMRERVAHERLAAGKHVLLDAIVPSVEKLNDLFLEGKALDYVKADLRTVTKALVATCGNNADEYAQALVELFAEVSPPELPSDNDNSLAASKRRRKLEAEIAARMAREEQETASATAPQQSQGYFAQRRKG